MLGKRADGRRGESTRRAECEYRSWGRGEALEQRNEPTALQIFLGVPVGQERDAESPTRQDRHRLAVVGSKTASHRDRDAYNPRGLRSI